MLDVSYGGGVQSTALMVLAGTEDISVDAAVFANVGDDSENPATLSYVREIMVPWAAKHGIDLHEVRSRTRSGEIRETLLEHVLARTDGLTPLPVKLTTKDGTVGGIANRTCTATWKAAAIRRWLRDNGATRTNPANLAIGISTDEFERATTGRDKPYERRHFPLLDLRLDRSDCRRLIAEAGLPIPPKSACWFCPFTPLKDWRRIRRDTPVFFDNTAALEGDLNSKRSKAGLSPVWWTSRVRPMDEAVLEAQPTLPGMDGAEGCDEGYCWV